MYSNETLTDNRDWDEKSLSDFDEPQTSAEDDDACQSQLIQNNNRLSSNKSIRHAVNNRGTDYPFDMWYLIGMHIAPEDISRFALICRSSNQVVNTVGFWISLLRRYDKFEARKISKVLRREHLTIVRTYVVQSLYQSYPLFKQRFNRADAIQKDPHFLVASRCIRIWYSKREPTNRLYNFYFEFQFDDTQWSKGAETQPLPVSTIFEANKQLLLNKNSYILHVVTSTWVRIGPFMGMALSQLTLNVSSDYRYHKLKMWFDSPRSYSNKPKHNNPIVLIDPVLCLRVYRWYDCPAELD